MADLSITAANVDPGANAVLATGTAGETITAGQVLYQNASNSDKLALADADLSQAAAAAVGIAVNGAADDQPIHYIVSGDLDLGATLTVGEIYVVSGTAGGVAPEGDLASADWPTVLGIADASNNLKVSIVVGEAVLP